MFVQKTFSLKSADSEKKWYLIDAEDLVLGRLATQVADLLRGKNKTTFTTHVDSGDFVVITNCEKVKMTGAKWDKKFYYRHTGYIGGIKQRSAKEQLEKHPELIIYEAVKGMLPKTSLGRKQLTKLKIFVGEKHEHDAQQPEAFKIQG